MHAGVPVQTIPALHCHSLVGRCIAGLGAGQVSARQEVPGCEGRSTSGAPACKEQGCVRRAASRPAAAHRDGLLAETWRPAVTSAQSGDTGSSEQHRSLAVRALALVTPASDDQPGATQALGRVVAAAFDAFKPHVCICAVFVR